MRHLSAAEDLDVLRGAVEFLEDAWSDHLAGKKVRQKRKRDK
jgi:hypothetical protein